MKTRLPKKLLVAVLAAMFAGTPSLFAEYSYEYTTSSTPEAIYKDVTLTLTEENGLPAIVTPTATFHYAPIVSLPEALVQNSVVNFVSGESTYIVSADAHEAGAVYGTRTLNMSGGKAWGLVGGLVLHDDEHDKTWFSETGGVPYKSKEKVTINVTGGEVARIMGGSFHSGGSDLIKALGGYSAIAVGGDVEINVSGGKVTERISGGGGGDGCVDGTVYINISDAAQINCNIYGGARNDAAGDIERSYVGGTSINIKGGTITGNIYGGGSHDNYSSLVKGNTSVTIAGGTVTGNVYGGGEQDIIEGNSTVTLSGGTVNGNVYAAGKANTVKGDATVVLLGKVDNMTAIYGGGSDDAQVQGKRVLQIGNSTTHYTDVVPVFHDFTHVEVAAESMFSLGDRNVFSISNNFYTLSAANLTQAAVNGATANATNGVSITLRAAGKLASGKYMLVTSDEAPEGWSSENVEVDGLGTYEDLQWEGNTLYFYYSALAPEAAIASNWGVFKSSQAFTGTLWGNRSNAVEIPQGRTVTDEKGISTTIAPTGKTLAWATVYGQSGRISGAGADYNLYGAAMGVEHQFASGSSVGAAMGYDWGKVSPFTQSAVDQETLHAALYGRAWAKQLDAKSAVALDWSVAYGQTESSHDNVAEDWSQDSWQFDVRATYSRALTERLTASGFVGVQYYTHDSDTPDGLEMSSMQNLRVSVGAGLNYAATEKTNVYGELSVYRDAMRHNPYVAIEGTRFYGTNPGRTGVNVGVGAQHAISEQWSVRGGYNFQAAEDSTEHNVNVGAVYTF